MQETTRISHSPQKEKQLDRHEYQLVASDKGDESTNERIMKDRGWAM